jgi:hypothetical protein
VVINRVTTLRAHLAWRSVRFFGWAGRRVRVAHHTKANVTGRKAERPITGWRGGRASARSRTWMACLPRLFEDENSILSRPRALEPDAELSTAAFIHAANAFGAAPLTPAR